MFPVGNKALDGEDERDYDLLAGDALYIPRSVTHAQGMRILGDQPASAIEMFAPIRTDYLYIAEHQLTFNAPERQPDGSRIETRSFDEMTHQKEVNVARP